MVVAEDGGLNKNTSLFVPTVRDLARPCLFFGIGIGEVGTDDEMISKMIFRICSGLASGLGGGGDGGMIRIGVVSSAVA